MPSSCPLCEPEQRTEWHYEGDWLLIIDCESCGTPMAVLRDHEEFPERHVGAYMEGVCRGLFGPDIEFRKGMRNHEDHYHFHVIVGGNDGGGAR